MAAEYIGGMSVGAAVPTLLNAQLSLLLNLQAQLGELTARFAAVAEIGINLGIVPPDINASLALLASAALNLQAALALPQFSLNITVVADLSLELGLLIAALELQISAVIELGNVLATAGVHMYLAEGPIGQMGNDLQSQLSSGMPGGSGPTQEGVAFVLLAGSPVSIAALRTVFGQ